MYADSTFVIINFDVIICSLTQNGNHEPPTWKMLRRKKISIFCSVSLSLSFFFRSLALFSCTLLDILFVIYSQMLKIWRKKIQNLKSHFDSIDTISSKIPSHPSHFGGKFLAHTDRQTHTHTYIVCKASWLRDDAMDGNPI